MADALPVETLAEAVPYLRRPFSPEAMKFRPVGGGFIVAYLDARLAGERLNAVIPGKWETRFEPYPGGKQIQCFLTVDGLTRSDVGTQGTGANIDPVKVGFSDSFKRAAVHFGVGVSIYALKQVRISDLPANGTRGDGKSKTITAEGETWLRRGYRKWLNGPGKKHFGEALAHGDEEGAVGDPEAAPADVGGEEVIAPSLELEAARAELEALFDRIPAEKKRGKLTKAKFSAQLRAAAESEEKLAALKAEIEKLA